jgi:deazaflavin-dependent oxidoreductase (nitroreductase family)
VNQFVFRATSALNKWLYRLSGGKIAGSMKGAPILLLTTTGRKTGKARVTPLLYLRDGDNLVLVASKGGAPKHPVWFLNLEANPDVEVEVGRTRERRRARSATPEERERLWSKVVEMYSSYADYQTKTAREIPLVILEPA